MAKKYLLVATCACALIGPVAVAQAAAKKHSLNDAVSARVLTSNSKLIVYTGTIKDKVNGAGAVVTQSTPTSTAGKVNQMVEAFFKNGSLTLKGVTNATTDPGGNTTYTGTLKAVSGTGAFKGVKGTVKLTGAATSADPTLAAFKATGTLTY
jgi:hypothetical protein